MKALIAALALLLLAAGPTFAAGSPLLAPGPALPGNAVTGGIGPGTTQIAPGLATGSLIQQEGSGGVPLAIGSHDSTLPAVHRSRR
jgi:hypothetical protein